MLKRLVIFAKASLLVVASALAQSGEFQFQEESFDFGMVNEGVQAEHEFVFKNTGSTPIVISNVRASCGCTTPNWTKDPVAPGATGTIKASFNSQGRPGVFNKSITITSNAVESSKVLFIKGVVESGATKPEYSEDELKKSPEHKLDKNEYNFGKIERGQKVVKEFTIKNTGKNSLSITKGQSACNCIKYTLTPEVLEHNKSGKLEIIYSPYQDGPNKDIITLSTNDLKKPNVQITLAAEVVENLTNQSPVKENNPVPFK